MSYGAVLAYPRAACHLAVMTPSSQSEIDQRLMRRALALARRGIGTTHPNPRVGAVVVAGDRIIAEGWHRRPGEAHAEATALQKAGEAARGATLYVTLEPCSGHGRTPPCTDVVIQAGVRRVVYASNDPNPRMAGGAEKLRETGIEVCGGVLREDADALNRPFFHFICTGHPYVIAKAAVSLDGKLATHRQHSQWISGEDSRRHAHRLRAASDAIIVGAGTLTKDNPSLTVRGAQRRGEPPLRVVICDHMPAFRPDYRLLDGQAPCRLYARDMNGQDDAWRAAGAEVVSAGRLDAVLRHLGEEGRLSLLLEGGGRLHASFFEARLADELVLYQAPLLIGGTEAVSLWHGAGVAHVSDALRLVNIERRRLGEDQMIRGRIRYPEG